MFSTLFSLSQLILMGRSSTITDLIVKWVCTEAYNSVPMLGFLEPIKIYFPIWNY